MGLASGSPPRERQSVKRVLIVRLGALGDIVHALPVLGALKDEWPLAQIDWIVDARYADILNYVEGLHRRIVVRAATPAATPEVVSFAGGRGFVGAWRFMRQQRYDVALDLQGLLKSAVLARLSGARRVIGFTAAMLREPQAVWFYNETVSSVADAHIIQKNLAVLAALDIRERGLRFPLRVPQSRLADEMTHVATDTGDGRFAVMNPGGGWANKRWPAARFGELAARLWAEQRIPSFVLWGPGEESLAHTVVKRSLGAASRLPATTLGEVLAVAARAAIVVSGDTGPLHLATALGTPVVGLYGPTFPSRNGPWHTSDMTVSRDNTCICHYKRRCVRHVACLDEIGVDEVFRAVSARLRQEPPD